MKSIRIYLSKLKVGRQPGVFSIFFQRESTRDYYCAKCIVEIESVYFRTVCRDSVLTKRTLDDDELYPQEHSQERFTSRVRSHLNMSRFQLIRCLFVRFFLSSHARFRSSATKREKERSTVCYLVRRRPAPAPHTT